MVRDGGSGSSTRNGSPSRFEQKKRPPAQGRGRREGKGLVIQPVSTGRGIQGGLTALNSGRPSLPFVRGGSLLSGSTIGAPFLLFVPDSGPAHEALIPRSRSYIVNCPWEVESLVGNNNFWVSTGFFTSKPPYTVEIPTSDHVFPTKEMS